CGSFMDYAIVRADDVPSFGTECDESQPCTHNPLGAKGCGESGAIGAPAAVIGAALDALAPLGVTDLDMPLTSEQVWRRIRLAQADGQMRGDGLTVVRAANAQAAREIAEADPFVVHGLRSFELREWTVMEGSLGIKLHFSDQSLELA